MGSPANSSLGCAATRRQSFRPQPKLKTHEYSHNLRRCAVALRCRGASRKRKPPGSCGFRFGGFNAAPLPNDAVSTKRKPSEVCVWTTARTPPPPAHCRHSTVVQVRREAVRFWRSSVGWFDSREGWAVRWSAYRTRTRPSCTAFVCRSIFSTTVNRRSRGNHPIFGISHATNTCAARITGSSSSTPPALALKLAWRATLRSRVSFL